MEKIAGTLIAMAFVAKYVELLKDETKGLDDTITVEKSIDLLSRATTEFLKDMSKVTQEPKNKA